MSIRPIRKSTKVPNFPNKLYCVNIALILLTGFTINPFLLGGLGQGQKFPTTGSITNGAIMEREINYNFHKKRSIRMNLNNPDFTTAARIETILNHELGGKYASAKDASTIDLIIPTF